MYNSLYGKATTRGSRRTAENLHGVSRLSGGCRSWALNLGGAHGLSVRGPSPWLVLLKGVGAGLNPSQGASVADVHLLRSHLFTAGALEPRATHTGMGSAAGATVLAGGLAVS